MSSTFSAELAASLLASKEPGCEPSPSARSIRSAGASSPNTGQASPSMKTLPSSEAPTLDQLTLFAEVFPVRTSAARGMDRGLPAPVAAYGVNTPDLLANFDPGTSSWRTSQHCLLEGLTVFSETWPRSGLMRSGTAYQLPPLAPLTKETEYGSLLPTPTASEMGSNTTMRKRGQTLVSRVKMWRTPTASDATKWNNQSMAERLLKGQSLRLCTQVSPEGGSGGRLNPTWVEWLMGFPLGWTALNPLATPSSRKSPKSSAARS